MDEFQLQHQLPRKGRVHQMILDSAGVCCSVRFQMDLIRIESNHYQIEPYLYMSRRTEQQYVI